MFACKWKMGGDLEGGVGPGIDRTKKSVSQDGSGGKTGLAEGQVDSTRERKARYFLTRLEESASEDARVIDIVSEDEKEKRYLGP
ncbi:uncharacterized protein SPSK_08197 [Sporothrix schenckii 1099-18]|uniref:Uncharacterized protein n=1 Tax=Sporothrix schenckii 1099-18 TaxID=1397361 RepID=A0A0F2MDX4_SPOSC|nr:uncharacterized protein SPSK_08197 [Sporothrix schenckii 1099-18]KJR87842.1 hypothetical protein SPSK_08197 [Sporothrix schenckii 1099-18]